MANNIRKKHLKKSLLIDVGNSYTKMAIASTKLSKIFKYKTTSNLSILNKKFAHYKHIDNIYILATSKIDNFYSVLTKKFSHSFIKVIVRNDFKNKLDLSNINKKVIIGSDILLLGWWCTKQTNIKAIICLGTVYFALIMQNNKYKSILLIPSITNGLDQISKITCISDKLIPDHFYNCNVFNTPSCFSNGVNLLADGFVSNIIKKFKLTSSQIVITGGDANKYQCLKKYKIINDLTLHALNKFIKK